MIFSTEIWKLIGIIKELENVITAPEERDVLKDWEANSEMRHMLIHTDH